MALFADSFTTLVFKTSIRDHPGQVSLTTPMLKVLVELDGRRNLAEVNRTLRMSPENLKNIVEELHKLQLVEPVETAWSGLNSDFFEFLKNRLSVAMGPIAEFIVEEELQKMTGGTDSLSIDRAAELVDLLSRQIHRNEKRMAFQQEMVKKIRELMQD